MQPSDMLKTLESLRRDLATISNRALAATKDSKRNKGSLENALKDLYYAIVSFNINLGPIIEELKDDNTD